MVGGEILLIALTTGTWSIQVCISPELCEIYINKFSECLFVKRDQAFPM